MKVSKFLIPVLGMALLLSSCVREQPYQAPVRPDREDKGDDPDDPDTPGDPSVREICLEAVIEEAQPEVKSALGKDGAITWTAGDEILVHTSAGKWEHLALDTSPGVRRGVFTGKIGKDESLSGYAVHVSDPDVAFTESGMVFSLPAENPSVPLVASVEAEDKTLAFKALTGAVCVIATAIPSGADRFVLEADNPICGQYSAEFGALSLTAAEEGGTRVSMSITEGADSFVVPVPAGTYTLSGYFAEGESVLEDSRFTIGTETIDRGMELVFENGVITNIKDIYVTPEGAGRQNGKSWENAFALEDLSDIFTGQASEENIARYGGATVHVAGGTYKPVKALNFDFTKSSEAVTLTFQGGWDPETGIRDASAHPTVIEGSASENGRYARFDLRSHLVFEDIQFKDFASGISLFYLWTGASNKDIDILFRRCSFSGNKTVTATNGVVYGGAFFVRGGLLRLESCSLQDNEATRGGAISVLGDGKLRISGTPDAPTVISGNKADTGGALYIENTLGEVNVSNARIQDNEATRDATTWAAGGAVSLMRNNATGTMAVSFTDCEFIGNKAPKACAGAIGLYNAEQKSLTLTRCRFEGNECYSRGGALFTDSGANGADVYRITDCSFIANKVTGTASGTGYGGAVDVQNNFKGTMYVSGCIFEGNTAGLGGGAWADYNNNMVHRVFFNACRFHGNYAETGANGNALYHCSGYMALHNCALWDNFEASQATPRDILSGASSAGAVVLSQTTIHQGGGNAPVYINSNTIRLNVVNSILATSGYPASIKSGASYATGSSGDHVLMIGKSSAFYTGNCAASILLGYDAWKDKFTDGYNFDVNLSEINFVPMEQSSSAFIRGLGGNDDIAFDTWLSGLGVYNRDIDGKLRSGSWAPGCVQFTSEASAQARKVSILGDSISTYDGFLSGSPVRPHYPRGDVQDVTQTWWHPLIYKKMSNATLEGNYAYSGSQVARATYPGYSQTTWYGQSFIEKYLRDGCGNPDVVFIFGGTNDYMHKDTGICPDAPDVIYNTTYTAPESVLEQIVSNTDAAVGRADIAALPDQNFSCAYAKLLRLVKYDHPDAVVVCIVGDILTEAVQKSILYIAGHYNCPVVDFFAANGYNDVVNVPKIDNVHPTSEGMAYICNKIYTETKAYIE